jgi:hypothetical protein
MHDVAALSSLNTSLLKFFDTVVSRTHSDDQLANDWLVVADVRDVALLFALAARNAKAAGGRFLVIKGMSALVSAFLCLDVYTSLTRFYLRPRARYDRLRDPALQSLTML